jgi:hypothetical protein
MCKRKLACARASGKQGKMCDVDILRNDKFRDLTWPLRWHIQTEKLSEVVSRDEQMDEIK